VGVLRRDQIVAELGAPDAVAVVRMGGGRRGDLCREWIPLRTEGRMALQTSMKGVRVPKSSIVKSCPVVHTYGGE
jgi:hypothetical protein